MAAMLAPLGFENTYAIAVRRATSDSLGLHTLSDLAKASTRLRAGLTPDFIGRLFVDVTIVLPVRDENLVIPGAAHMAIHRAAGHFVLDIRLKCGQFVSDDAHGPITAVRIGGTRLIDNVEV